MFGKLVNYIMEVFGLNKDQKRIESDIRFGNIREAMRGFGSDK